MFLVKRPFRNFSVILTAGSLIADPASVKKFKQMLREGRIVEVAEHNFEEYKDYFLQRHGIDISDESRNYTSAEEVKPTEEVKLTEVPEKVETTEDVKIDEEAETPSEVDETELAEKAETTEEVKIEEEPAKVVAKVVAKATVV